MRTRFRHFGLLLALSAVWSAGRASDIDCARTQQSAERVICDHAILNHQYDRIYGQQQVLTSAGKLSAEDLVDWRQLRNACTDVHCMEGVFAQWKSKGNAIGSRAPAQVVPATAAAAAPPLIVPVAASASVEPTSGETGVSHSSSKVDGGLMVAIMALVGVGALFPCGGRRRSRSSEPATSASGRDPGK